MSDPQSTTTLLTQSTILTAAGSTVAVWAVGNALRVGFRVNVPWIPLLLSLVLSFAIAYKSEALTDPLSWLLALVNGCIIFLAATGVQQTATAEGPKPQGVQQEARPRVRFLTPWFTPR